MIQRMFVTLDTKKTNYKNVGKINHGDDLILELTVLSDGDMISFNDPMVDLLVKKSDGKMIRQNSGIEHIKPNKFVIEVSKDCVTSPGLTTNQLVINDNGRISTCMFYYTILNSLEEDVIQSISNVEVLEQLDEYVIEARERMELLNNDINKLEEFFGATSDTLVEAEMARNEAEQKRVQSEILRVNNENDRIEADNIRNQNDSIRNQNEVDRSSSELVREQRESERILNEEERHQNESERMIDESTRQQNENARQSNESIRMSNETDRKTQENRRVTAETNRVNAETTRRNNENSRISNETERQKTMNEMKSLLEDARGFDDRVGVVEDEIEEINSSLDTITTNVENFGATVEKIHNDFYNVKVIDLKNEKDFDINNISTCVNRVFSTIENYTTVKLNADLCYITTPINITMKEGCELILNCKIKCKADFNAININGNCASNNVFIKSLESFDKVNFNTILGCGLTLDNYYNSSVFIGEMLGFNIGLLLKGTYGSQYNKIDFFSISNCNECIVLNPLSQSHWVNENTFKGGRLGGDIGIHLKGISNSDIINNNKFYNIGFEGINTLLIKAVGARYNSLCNPRVLEDYPETSWVEEEGSCMGNEYNFTFPVKASRFKLNYLSEINAPLTADNGKTISQIGGVCDWDIRSETMKLQYKYFLGGILMTDNDFNDYGGTITLDECFKEVYCQLSTSTRVLRIAKHLLYNGFSFNLYITSATSGSLKLEYYSRSGNLKSGTNFLGNGVYKVTMYNYLLVYTQIGDEFKMV